MKGTVRYLFFVMSFLSILHSSSLEALAQWTVMIYAQADKKLNSFAARNFNTMATIGSNHNLNILVQWNQPNKNGTWRYKIDKNKMTLVQSNTQKKGFAQDLVDFVQFCKNNHPAQKYALVFWNHGVGIIDPEWHNLYQFAVNPQSMRNDPRFQFGLITKGFNDKRGILFDMAGRRYMNNQDLKSSLSQISTQILKKKINLVGMDACLMAMVEIGYQIRECTKYLVASEEVELAQGWNYLPVLSLLAQSPIKTKQVIEAIVYTFKDFYQNKTQYYTQSAIKLENIDFIKQNIDQVAGNIQLCSRIDNPKMVSAIQNARKLCLQFTTPCYVDLHSFYTELQKQLESFQQLSNIRLPALSYARPASNNALINSQPFADLLQALRDGKKIIDATIVANIASPQFSRARGLSIYFPRRGIDKSYYRTEFGQDSLWIEFLKEVVGK